MPQFDRRRKTDRAPAHDPPVGSRPARSSRPSNWVVALASAGALLLGLIIYGAVFEADGINVKRVEMPLNDWPRALDGLRVAVVSDIHAGSLHVREGKLERIVDEIDAVNPDVILLLGDFVIDDDDLGGQYQPPEYVAPRLRRLDAPLGVFAVLGNHEWKIDGYRSWRALEDAGIDVLENDVVRLRHRGAAFAIAGIADERTSTPDVAGTLRMTRRGEPVILSTHNPNAFIDVPPTVALGIGGHTHGGQVNLPVLAPLIQPEDLRRYKRGIYRSHGRTFFVTIGVGTSGVPIRIGAPPEIALLVLRSPRG